MQEARVRLSVKGRDLRYEPNGLEAHAGKVDRAAISSDGTLAVTASSADGTIRIWDVATRSLRAVHPQRGSRFDRYRALAFEPSGGVIVIADGRGSVERIDTKTGALLTKHVIDPLGFETCALSKNGAFLACAQGTKLEVWSAVDGKRISTIDDPSFYDPTDHKAEMRAFVFDFDDDDSGPSERQTRIRQIVVSDDGKAEPSFDYPADALVFEPPMRSFPTSLALTRSGALVVGRYGGTVTVHAPTGDIVRTYAPEPNVRRREVLSVAVSHDDEIAIGRYDASIELVLPSGDVRVLHSGTSKHSIGVRALAWSPDGTLVVGLNDEGRARWARSNGTRGTFMENDGAACLAIAFHPSGESFATTSCAKKLHVWSARDLACVRTVSLGGRPLAVAFSPSGTALAVTVEEQLLVDERVVASLDAPASLGAIVWLDDDRIAGGASDGTIYVWSTKDIGPARIVIEGHSAAIESMIALDPKTLVTASRDGVVARWDLDQA